jgi:hypothetical protein
MKEETNLFAIEGAPFIVMTSDFFPLPSQVITFQA